MTEQQSAWLDRVRAAWSERAAQWDEMSEANAETPGRATDLERMATALGLQPGSRLLDAGCGSGQFAIGFARRGCRVTGIDLSPEMIARARSHSRDVNLDVEWRVGQVAELDDGDATYDAVFARVVLQFVPDVPATLAEFRRVLKSGGRLLTAVPGALSPIYNRSWRRFIEPASHGTNLMVPWEMEAVLQELGWTIHEGWGEFSSNLTGDENPFGAALAGISDRRLHQAASTTWTVIAS